MLGSIREREAGKHAPAVDQNRTCTALTVIAALFRPGEVEMLASASSSVVRRSRETRCSLLFTRSDMFTGPPGFRNPSACADSDGKACAMAGNTADDAVAVRNLLRLGRRVGLAVCAAMRWPMFPSLFYPASRSRKANSAIADEFPT